MSLTDSPFVANVRQLLQMLDSEDLLALARTATNNRILPLSSKEAVDIILLYTPDLGRLFSYRRMTSQVLFHYLHSLNIPSTGCTTKNQLIVAVQECWEKQNKEKSTSEAFSTKRKASSKSEIVYSQVKSERVKPADVNSDKKTNYDIANPRIPTLGKFPNQTTINQTLNIHVNRNLPDSNFSAACTFQPPRRSAVRSDQFAHNFCEWYFNMVNRLQPHCAHLPGDTFSQDVFFQNSSADVYLIGSTTSERHAEGQANTFQLLRDTFNEFRLLFSPNISSGIQAHKSNHGMVRILSCGTLHCSDSFVGIFEQENGLACSPVDGSWKIMYMKINLKQSDFQTELPSLPPCQVFEIVQP